MTKIEKPYQIEIAGVGGTGVLTAAMLIGNSALVQDIYVVQSEIHGMAQRGGVVNTEIRLGSANGPLIPDKSADVLLSFELGETARAAHKIIPKDGYVIMNSHIIVPPSLSAKKGAKYPEMDTILGIVKQFTDKVYVINAFELASEAGDLRSQNVVLVGALFAIPGFPLTKDSLKKALEIRFRGNEKVVASNMKAFELGFNKMKELMK
ncbi:MAG TPA: indolepyruvate oxidoreductase subunit beta [candidate division Zixibacteria bacterium]|nr:indolepyruvate oxidoreductase subunit beta [candidate division Zixibacteria bacterium]